MKRLNPESLVKLDRPFSIFVEPGDVDKTGKLTWMAKTVGYELDQFAFSDSPLGALKEATNVIRMLAGICTGGQEHAFDHEVTDNRGIFAWRCSKCLEVAPKELLVDA